MKSSDILFPEILYHSYIVEGDPINGPYTLRDILLSRGDINSSNADLLIQVYDSFAIGDSAMIKDWHSTKSMTDAKKICIIGAKFINREAEQSLLKILEEPHESTHFFLVVPNAGVLLPTIRSRMHTVQMFPQEKEFKSAHSFLKALPNERLEMVASLIEESKDAVSSGSVRFNAIFLINGIEEIVRKKLSEDTSNEHSIFLLSELQKMREYLGTPGASVKMILEHIALIA